MTGTYTADELLAGIHAALVAHDMNAVADMVHALALVDPHAADAILGAVNARRAVR